MIVEAPQMALESGSDVVLRDGSTVHLRPTAPGDVEGVAGFLRALSEEARWFRFMGSGGDATRAARELVAHGTGLLAIAGPDDEIVAHASFVPETADHAELAFAVATRTSASRSATASVPWPRCATCWRLRRSP